MKYELAPSRYGNPLAIASLRVGQTVLDLTEFEGPTQKQLAERLGMSLSGAKSHVQRGREKLREASLDCCQFEFDRRRKIIDCTPKDAGCCQAE